MNAYQKDMIGYLKDAQLAVRDALDLIFDRMEDDPNWYDNELESDLASIENDIREAIDYVRED